jgi:mannose-1-phosphate guanylyltransferase/mannose-6-phosphate isomerase
MKKNIDRAHLYALLLAGGQGSRFWPQSRTLEPKQFLKLHKEKSLFEQTVLRVLKLVPAKNIFIATSRLYFNQICEYIVPYRIPPGNLILEPDSRNTAPSIAVSVKLIHNKDNLARVAVLPCDHLIEDNGLFCRLLRTAFGVCSDNLVIFGVSATRPATGYGYIQAKKVSDGCYKVLRFHEKPNLKKARFFVRSGNFFWNSGILVGSCPAFFCQIRKHLPGLMSIVERIGTSRDIDRYWKKIEPVSFDYGVLEKSNSLIMLKAPEGMGWSDLGSWQAWDELLPKDKQKNALIGEVVALDNNNTTVVGERRLIATIGLENLIVVDTPDALLVTKKDRSEEVKSVVDILKKNKRLEHYYHKTVKRPWGSYTVLDTGMGFKIKLVEVNSGRSLSLQLHKKRSEHWVVVAGCAKIVHGKKNYLVKCNQSTYIPSGCVHRISNPGNDPLKIVEVQTGTYLEEDDIIRLEDDYNLIPGQKSR